MTPTKKTGGEKNQHKQREAPGTESVDYHPRIGYHGGTVAEISGSTFFIAHDRSLAEDYASDTQDGRVIEVEDRSVNPLILNTPEKFVNAWRASGADKVRGNFHPDQTRVFGDWARRQGYDAIVIPKSAFEGELGYQDVGGTVGEPQTIILDPKAIRVVKLPNARRERKDGNANR